MFREEEEGKVVKEEEERKEMTEREKGERMGVGERERGDLSSVDREKAIEKEKERERDPSLRSSSFKSPYNFMQKNSAKKISYRGGTDSTDRTDTRSFSPPPPPPLVNPVELSIIVPDSTLRTRSVAPTPASTLSLSTPSRPPGRAHSALHDPDCPPSPSYHAYPARPTPSSSALPDADFYDYISPCSPFDPKQPGSPPLLMTEDGYSPLFSSAFKKTFSIPLSSAAVMEEEMDIRKRLESLSSPGEQRR